MSDPWFDALARRDFVDHSGSGFLARLSLRRIIEACLGAAPQTSERWRIELLHEQDPFTSTSGFADAEPEVRARFRVPQVVDGDVMVRMAGSIAKGLQLEVRRTFAVLVSGETNGDGVELRVGFGRTDPVVGLELRGDECTRYSGYFKASDADTVRAIVEPSNTDLTLWARHESGAQSRVLWGAAEDAWGHVNRGTFVRRDDRESTVVGAAVPTFVVRSVSARDESLAFPAHTWAANLSGPAEGTARLL